MRFGTLVAAAPGRAAFRYAFSPRDALWLARFIMTTGPTNAARRQAIIWNTFERFAAHAQTAGGRPVAAAGAGTYRAFLRTSVPSIPRTPWRALPPGPRALALAAISGRLPGRANSSVRVVVAAPAAAYAGAGTAAGVPWQREADYWELEDAPPQTSPPAGPPTPSQPPPEAAPGVGDAPAMTADDAAVDDTGAVGGEEPTAPSTFPTSDGNALTLTPDLIQQLLAALGRQPSTWSRRFRHRHPHGTAPWPRWRYRQRHPHARFAPWGGAQGRFAAGRIAPWRYTGRGVVPGRWGRSGSGAGRPGWRRIRQGRSGVPRVAPFGARASGRRQITRRVHRLAGAARRIGALRNRQTGRRFPVFGGRAGGRNFRIVTRPRGGMRFEIMAIRSGELQSEMGRWPQATGREQGFKVRAHRMPIDLGTVVARGITLVSQDMGRTRDRVIPIEQAKRIMCMLTFMPVMAAAGKDRFFHLEIVRDAQGRRQSLTPPRIRWNNVNDYLRHPSSFGANVSDKQFLENLKSIDTAIFRGRHFVNNQVIVGGATGGGSALGPEIRRLFKYLQDGEKDPQNIYFCHKG